MREKALEQAVLWHNRVPRSESAKDVVDTANTFLLFLNSTDTPVQERKNPAANKGQPR